MQTIKFNVQSYSVYSYHFRLVTKTKLKLLKIDEKPFIDSNK